MGGKSSKVTDPDAQVPPVMVPHAQRKCRDIIWILLFLAYWGGMGMVGWLSYQNGDPARLLYATDSWGNQCGGTDSTCIDGTKCGQMIAYPRIEKDMAAAIQNGVDITDPTQVLNIPFYGVCVSSCPEAGEDTDGDGEIRDWVCSYNNSMLLNSLFGANPVNPELPSVAAREALETCLQQKASYPGPWADQFLTDTDELPCKTLMQDCFKIYVEERNLFFRCIPQNVENTTCTSSPYLESVGESASTMLNADGEWVPRPSSHESCGVCLEPALASDGSPMDPGSKECRAKKVYASVESTEVQVNPVFEQVNSWSAVLVRWMGDIQLCLWQILACGGGAAIALGCVWLLLLRFFASIFVWTTIWALLLGFLFLSVQLLIYGDVITTSMLSDIFAHFNSNNNTNVEDTAEDVLNSVFSSKEQSTKQVYEICGYVMCGITAIYFVMILAMARRIRLAVGVLKEATKAVAAMPMILLFPVTSVAATLGISAYCFLISLYICSSGTIEMSQVEGFTAQIANLTGARRLSNVSDAAASIAGVAMAEFQNSNLNTYFFLYNFFGFLWTNQVIAAVSCTTIAGAVASWYWASVDEKQKAKEMPRSPVFASLRRVLRFHLGSMIFGAFIIAVVQFIRAILAYLDKQTQSLQKKNKLVMIIMKVVQCCLWCFEKILKFVTKHAFIMVAIHGSSFCTSTKNAFSILLANIARIGVATAINNLLMLLAKLVITVGASAGSWVLISITQTDNEAPSTIVIPVLATALISWYVAGSFLSVYGLAVDTVMVSLCEDEKRNDGSAQRPFYMTKTLLKIANKSNKVYEKSMAAKRAAAEDDESGNGPEAPSAVPQKSLL